MKMNRGRPKKYMTAEDARAVQNGQKRAWDIKHRAECHQLLGSMSETQAKIIKCLTSRVIQNEPLLQAFLNRIQSRISFKNEDEALPPSDTE